MFSRNQLWLSLKIILYDVQCAKVCTMQSCVDLYDVTEKTGLWRDVKFNPVPIEEYFHIIDEIGRSVLL